MLKWFIISISLTFSSLTYSNSMIKLLKQKSANGDNSALQLQFSDGYKQLVTGPFNVKDRPAMRCPCKIYDISFTDPNGVKVTRTVEHSTLKTDNDEKLKWSGADGQTYILSNISDKNGNNQTGQNAPKKQSCHVEGELKQISIRTQKILPESKQCYKNRAISCLGEKINICYAKFVCKDDPTYGTGRYEMSCMPDSTTGQCPEAYACAADTSLDQYKKDAKGFGEQIIDTSTGKVLGL